MNDYIEIIDEDGKETTYEVVSTFKLEGYSSNYILYKEIDNSHLYIAKYNGTSMSDLDTNLSEEELALARGLFEEVVVSDDRN